MTEKTAELLGVPPHVKRGFELTRDEGLEMAARHLDLLYGGLEEVRSPGTYYIRLMACWKQKLAEPPFRRVLNFYPSGLKDAKAALPGLFELNGQGYDAYVAVNARKEPTGNKADTGPVRTVHTEVDATPGLTASDIGARITSASPPASFSVVTGPHGGAHPYYLSSDDLPVRSAERFNRDIAEKFGAKDSVHDVSRMLRLAGTRNTKDEYAEYPPFRAVLVEQGAAPAKYTLEELNLAFGSTAPLEASKAPQKTKEQAPVFAMPQQECPGWLEPLLSVPAVCAAWNRVGPNVATDASDADFHLLCQVLETRPETTDKQLAALLRAFRQNHGDNPEKALRTGYIEASILAARSQRKADSGDFQQQLVLGNWLRSFGELAEDMGEDTFPPWLVERVLTTGSLGILGAFPKHLKSVVACYLAVSVASGRSFLGEYPVRKKGPVLYVAAEDSERIVYGRLRRIAAGLDIPNPVDLPIYVASRVGLKLSEVRWQRALLEAVKRLRPPLIIFDPLRALFGGDENDSGVARRIADLTLPLREIGDAAVLFTHHFRKSLEGPAGTGPGARLRGSGDWHASAETLLGLSNKKDLGDGQFQITLSGEHREAGDLPGTIFKLEFTDDQLRATKSSSSWVVLTLKILHATEEAGEQGANKTAIAEEVGGNRKEVFRAVKTLIKQGRLVPAPGQNERGRGVRYVVADEDEEFEELCAELNAPCQGDTE